ncbi:sigma 54-interacting transcriptional regulator [Psychrobacter sanguinis]|uniref:sigma 54-interacting transcriptional regulator n=1 Tax=Psychrobacter sanguinis TaxID=861445 RepID=UPI001917BD58|nr:sigma 54-interacting transcriptional regulator [Psychrobacter sanguinis]MCC3307137.1 sigma 54-interacting transcriptional regulator [Psychrobacter sanguinis]UEC24502.1 sigma 54-interacting transcriptional regulator [Psychrobacter sanguinis]
MTIKHSLWLIDDDPALRLILEDTFNDAGLEVQAFSNAKGAWAKLNDILNDHQNQASLPDVILTDIRMPMMDGLSFSQWMNKNFPDLPVIIMTAHSDLKSAVDSYDTGAFEYLPKPFDLDHAITVVKKAISTNPKASTLDSIANVSAPVVDESTTTEANTTGSASTKAIKKAPAKAAKPEGVQSSPIIGQSPAMQTVFRAIGRLASSPITVLITGESGTGKELVAGALHQNSPRQKKPFIALNMAAIPHELIESELFGHEKGAFTGATTQRQGRFEQADGGTLFLDEIGDMPFSTQTRLLRVLANGEFFRVGGQKPIKVDVRIIAATHQNLEQLVKEGKFREDLFYRLNVIRLPLPPLRARPDDIPELIEFFMSKAATEMKTDKKQLSPDALHVMQAFNWPGNVRQLENACRWITVMATGEVLGIEDLPPDLTEFAQNYFAIKDANDHNIDNSNDINNTLSLTTSESHPAFSTTERIVPEPVQTQSTDRVDTVSQHNFSTDPKFNTEPNFNTGNVASFTSAANSASQVSATNDHTIAQQSSWQNQLQTWATTALNQGKTDILQLATPEFETVLITVALEHTRGRKGEAADLLGWGRNTLTRKIKLLGIGEDNE